MKLTVDSEVDDLDKTLGEELLEPTRIYTESILRLLKNFQLNGISHITGGGIMENITRIIPKTCGLAIKKNSWDIPPIFQFLKKAGKVADIEMMRTFNNGIGMVAVVAEKDTLDVMDRLEGMGEKAFVIGEVVKREKDEDTVTLID